MACPDNLIDLLPRVLLRGDPYRIYTEETVTGWLAKDNPRLRDARRILIIERALPYPIPAPTKRFFLHTADEYSWSLTPLDYYPGMGEKKKDGIRDIQWLDAPVKGWSEFASIDDHGVKAKRSASVDHHIIPTSPKFV